MTEILIGKIDDKHILRIEGHAGYGVQGTDIVCAGISALAYAWINELQILRERKQIYDFAYEEGDGYLLITFSGEKEEALTAYETIIIGFMAIEENFSANLHVTRGEKIF